MVEAQRVFGRHQRVHRRTRQNRTGALAALLRAASVCAGSAAQGGEGLEPVPDWDEA